MNPVLPARRRAAAFDAAVESSSTAGLDAHTAELVELVGAMRHVAPPVARQDFVADLRERLLLAAETDLVAVPGPTSRPEPAARPQRRDRRIAVALGGLAVIGATTSMAVAAQSALPGDVLYPVKRAIEDTDTTLSARDAKGTELLDHASTRLAELHDLSGRTTSDDVDLRTQDTIESTLSAFSSQASEASDILLDRYAETGDEKSVTALKTFTGRSLSRLVALEADLPPDVRSAVLEAAQVLLVIDQAASDACPECDGLGITELPPTLVSAVSAIAPVDEVTHGSVDAPVVAPAAPTRKRQQRPGTTGTTQAPAPTDDSLSSPAADPSATSPAASSAPAVPLPTPRSRAIDPQIDVPDGTLLKDIRKLFGTDVQGRTPSPATPSPGTIVDQAGAAVGLDGSAVGALEPLFGPTTKP